mmetsp:Transcript_14304/g.25131  ORF Transcript_14304/g.25131 Transcript_14304/m.25131 type:complete len:127 (-) Transcript_14304:336-716(-)
MPRLALSLAELGKRSQSGHELMRVASGRVMQYFSEALKVVELAPVDSAPVPCEEEPAGQDGSEQLLGGRCSADSKAVLAPAREIGEGWPWSLEIVIVLEKTVAKRTWTSAISPLVPGAAVCRIAKP